MFLPHTFRTFCGLVGLAFVLSSCTSAPFPEIVDDDDYATLSSGESSFDVPVRKVSLKESSALGSDNENALYEGQEKIKASPKKKTKASQAEKISAAKVKPVITDELDEEDDALASINDEKFKAELKVNEVSVEETGPSVTYLVGTVYFNNGSSAVDSSYNRQLRDIVKEAKAKKATLNVYGYASSRTRNTDIVSHKMANFKVSSARAENVAAALRRAGMPSAKIKAEALSDSNPAYLEVMPEGERLNRRAEIYLSY